MANRRPDGERIEYDTLDTPRESSVTNILLSIAIFSTFACTVILSFIASRLYITPSDVQNDVKIVQEQLKTLQMCAYAHAETTDDSIVGLDGTGQVILWSDGASDMFGVPRNNAIGYGVSFMIPPNLKLAHLESFTSRMETKGKVFRKTLITEAVHSDGSKFDVEIDLTGITGAFVIGRFKRL